MPVDMHVESTAGHILVDAVMAMKGCGKEAGKFCLIRQSQSDQFAKERQADLKAASDCFMGFLLRYERKKRIHAAGLYKRDIRKV
eukprot:751268-Hanusia_phi.AAC.2